jgi:general secretion pathway protein L
MSFARDIGDFRDWWLEELQAIPSAATRPRSRRHPQVEYEISVAREATRVQRLADGATFETTPQELSDSLSRLFATERQPRVELVLEPGRYLERQLSSFRLPKRRARDMAELDIQSSTPLDPAEVLILFASRDRNRADHRYFIVKKEVIAPIVAAIEGASGQIAAVEIRAGGEFLEIDADGYRALSRRMRRSSLGTNLVKAGMLACLVGAVATFAHAHWRYAEGSRQLDAMTLALEANVKAVRALSEQRKRAVEQVEGVRAQKRQTTPLVRIWEELTRVIADDTWLADLSVDRDKVTFTGTSKSAAALIAHLEASALFRNPTFSGPVAKVPGTVGERFTIEMELER